MSIIDNSNRQDKDAKGRFVQGNQFGFKKGQSGNPNGRPKGVPNKVSSDIKELAAVYTPQALKTLTEICATGESEAARVAAANSLLDRAFGKPAQSHDVNHRSDQISELLNELKSRSRFRPMGEPALEIEQPVSDNRRNGELH